MLITLGSLLAFRNINGFSGIAFVSPTTDFIAAISSDLLSALM